MKIDTKNTLQEIGLQLDRNQFPRVYNGGIVKPSDTVIASSILGEDMNYVSSRQRRPQTRSRERTTRQQREAYRPWPPSGTSPTPCSGLRSHYEAELGSVQEAYPGTKIWYQEEGMWLLTESSVLAELGKKATFLCALPYSPNLLPRSWGFWRNAISYEWIGPRHTNFPEGSICAFDLKDNTWNVGDEIVKLLDLYTLWALRHEHLKVLGRWPGYQSAPYAYERMEELRDDEYCGCNNSEKQYRDCCKIKDLSKNKIAHALEFIRFTRGNLIRKPPTNILHFMHVRKKAPDIINIFS